MIKDKLKVPCERFEDNCAQTRTFSNTPFNMKSNYVLVHETEKGNSVFKHLNRFKVKPV